MQAAVGPALAAGPLDFRFWILDIRLRPAGTWQPYNRLVFDQWDIMKT
jgi:hypothetical protein